MMRRVPRRRRASLVSRLARPVVSLGLLAAGLVLSGAFVGIAIRENTVQEEARAAQQGIDAERAKNAQLQGQIADAKTDAFVVDKARGLGYVRPGEGLIAVERGPAGEPVVRINAGDGGRLARWVAVLFGAR